jgi:hypothetical protein
MRTGASVGVASSVGRAHRRRCELSCVKGERVFRYVSLGGGIDLD